jgi:hypothetical protein
MLSIMTTILMENDDGTYLPVDVTYEFIPGYPGSRIDPPEPDAIEVRAATVDGQDAPQWAWDYLTGDLGQEYLVNDANERAECAACDAAHAKMEATA